MRFFFLIPALLLSAAPALPANQPPVIAGGQNVSLWPENTFELRFLVRNNLDQGRRLPFTVEGPGVNDAGSVFVPRRHQKIVSFTVPSLPVGAHVFTAAFWDTVAEPDTVFWTASSTVLVVDSTTAPEIVAEFDPAVVEGSEPSLYQPIDKMTVVKIPKPTGFAAPGGDVLLWVARLTNPDPVHPNDLFDVSPDQGEIGFLPGEEITVTVTLSADAPVPFGTLNDLGFAFVTAAGETLFQISTPVVGDSITMFQEVTTGVPEPPVSPLTWSRLKSLFR
jgi:hypothetical protein